ncbi:hypothetical protein [Sporofaciens sp. JLR.KK001]|uniref:hypothetical protein n=1 Tax=Sporofaciens sp. JLR.KK001 TaxID=3112621 RepID=UPI002FEE9CA5
MDVKVEALPSEGYLTEGQEVNYNSENIILEEFTKERIVEKRLCRSSAWMMRIF